MAEGHRGVAMPLSRRLLSDRATSPGPLLRTTDSSCASVGVGCYLADGDMVRGAALAVLNATNRVLGNYISTR